MALQYDLPFVALVKPMGCRFLPSYHQFYRHDKLRMGLSQSSLNCIHVLNALLQRPYVISLRIHIESQSLRLGKFRVQNVGLHHLILILIKLPLNHHNVHYPRDINRNKPLGAFHDIQIVVHQLDWMRLLSYHRHEHPQYF